MPKGVRDNLAGMRFGSLVVIGRATKPSHWDCLCDCGKITMARGVHLKSGHHKSCGHAGGGPTPKHGMFGTPEYRAWENARSRCRNPKNRMYPYYGGRGITMLKEWSKSFVPFFEELGLRPSPNHSLDRIDGNRGYEPGNCRWATPLEQAHNKRSGS